MLAMVQSLKGLSQIKLAALIGTAVVLIGFFTFLALRISAPVYAPLYTNVPMEDASKIVAELDSQGIKYELRGNGTQILVPTEMVNRIRLQMAEKGLPSSGSVLGYELFDKSQPLGTTNFVLNLNQVRALEGELSRTISSFQQIEQARVHLVMPKRELFTRERVAPTASVAVKLNGAADLSRQEIAAIRHLVATAVPGLKPERITIVDNRGQLLAKGGDQEGSMNAYTEDAEQYRVDYENRLRVTVERLLEQSVGTGRVKAEVHTEIDFDRTIRNVEKFDPEGQVVRSVQSVTENEQSNDAANNANVSVGNNLPDANAGAGGGANSSSNRNRNEETTNYEITKEVMNSVKETGTVKRLSVAVLVDGLYPKNADGDPEYAPRTEEELKNLETLVKNTIGFDEKRGDAVSVVNMRFATSGEDVFEDDQLAWLKDDLEGIIQTLVLGGVAILAILLVVRPLVSRAIESAEMAQHEDELEAAALAAPSIAARLTDQSRIAVEEEDDEADEMINIDRIKGKIKTSSYNKINSLVDKHTEETLQIVRSWLVSPSG
jgi:flagellar M-ring protein FliF